MTFVLSIRYTPEEYDDVMKKATKSKITTTHHGKTVPNVAGYIRMKSLE